MNADTPSPERLARPRQIESLSPDQIVAVVLRLAMEVSVLRDRLHSHELLLAEHDLLSPESVDAFTPGPEANQHRKLERSALIEKIIADLS